MQIAGAQPPSLQPVSPNGTRQGRTTVLRYDRVLLMLTGSTAAFTAMRCAARRRTADAAFLSNASLAIGLEPDTPSALRTAAQLAVPTLADWAAIDWLVAGGTLERVASTAAVSGPLPADASTMALAQRAAAERRPAFEAGDAHARSSGACVAVPIARHQHVLGVITCWRSHARAFAESQMQTIEAYAQRIAAAMGPSGACGTTVDWRKDDSTLAVLAHELRTPAGAVLGWTRLLQTGRLTGATATRALAAIARSAETQSRLVSDMFDLSRIMLGTYRVRVEPIDITMVVLASIDAVAPSALARGIDIRCIDAGSAEYVAGDASRLQQAVTNVLNNAVHHTSPRGRISLTIVPGAEHIVLRIVDTGDGIPPELLPHIFEPLTRAAHGESTHDGAGLGLTLVRHIIELHGGTVTAESAGRGRGATFTLTVPRGRPRQADHLPSAPDRPARMRDLRTA
jgi:signal transduction histidine kinase